MFRHRPTAAIRNLARLGVVLAVLFGLLGHTAMGGENDCVPPTGTLNWSGDVAAGFDHAGGFASHARAHAHTHDAATAAHNSTVAAVGRVYSWPAFCPCGMASTSSPDIERPPRVILAG